MGVAPEIVTGHDYRSYSLSIKQALIARPDAGGLRSDRHRAGDHTDGLFRAIRARCTRVAMVTASHNENGWTGVKMGAKRPLTFGPDEMKRLKAIVLGGEGKPRAGGTLTHVSTIFASAISRPSPKATDCHARSK